ncbi:MAG: squalene/phytoene synthase family protein [Gemmatimonadota bacterium]|nr:squalene/phytoene synthase family protein [Gemmatimonadota bacterium]
MKQSDPASRLDDLLEKTSRTFALAIPLLPDPLRREVTVAYLLFRIADTFEDAVDWPPARRMRALADFACLLENPDPQEGKRLAAEWLRSPPVPHEGYLELLGETCLVMKCYGALRPPVRAAVGEHTRRTAAGMAEFVDRARGSAGVLRLESLQELRDYCYVVAGIVGEMLTELFLLEPGMEKVAVPLRARARRFGEALQLVNILKDSEDDASEGRVFLPASVSRSEVLSLARAELRAAAEYTLTLQRSGAADGVVAFNALPVRLAWATLDRVEAEGPGAKVSRAQLWQIIEGTRSAIAYRRPALELEEPMPPRRSRSASTHVRTPGRRTDDPSPGPGAEAVP